MKGEKGLKWVAKEVRIKRLPGRARDAAARRRLPPLPAGISASASLSEASALYCFSGQTPEPHLLGDV